MYTDYSPHHAQNAFDEDDANFRFQLSSACRFSDEDLAANKLGNLSGAQKVKLSIRALLPFAGMVSTLIGLITVAIGLYYFGPMIASRVRLMLYLGKYLMLGLGALVFGLIAFIIKFLLASGRVIHLISDLSEGKVVTVSGRLTTSKNEEVEDGLATFTKAKTETWCYVVKGEYFEVNEDAWSLMRERDGGNYRLYITPRSRYMVAIETAVAEPGARDPFKLEYRPA